MEVNYLVFNTLDSTNAEARRRIGLETAGHWTAITTDFQTNGKGQQGTRWQNVSEGGVYLSLLSPEISWEKGSMVPLQQWIALTVLRILQRFVPDAQIKWPNDLVVEGKKVGGILVEAQWRGSRMHRVIVGIGLNTQTVPNPPVPFASAVVLHTQQAIPTVSEWSRLLVKALVGALDSPLPFGDNSALTEEFHQALWRWNTLSPFQRVNTDKVWWGTPEATSRDGKIGIRLAETQTLAWFDLKEVEWVRQ